MTPADADELDRRGRSRPAARARGRRRAGRRIPRRRRWRSCSGVPAPLTAPSSRQADDEQAERVGVVRSSPHSRGPASGRPRRRCRQGRRRAPRRPSRGPIAGRSARNSWPGLAHLTRTPRFLPASRPCVRSALTRSSRPSVPSMPSSAMARPPIATAAWPISSAPIARAAASAAAMIAPVGLAVGVAPGHRRLRRPADPGTISCAPTTLTPPIFESADEGAAAAPSSPLASRRATRGSKASSARLGLRLRQLRAGGRCRRPSTTWVTPRRLSSGPSPAKSSSSSVCMLDRTPSSAISLRPCSMTTNGLWPAAFKAFGDIDRQPAAARDHGRPCRRLASAMRRCRSVVVIVAVVVAIVASGGTVKWRLPRACRKSMIFSARRRSRRTRRSTSRGSRRPAARGRRSSGRPAAARGFRRAARRSASCR